MRGLGLQNILKQSLLHRSCLCLSHAPQALLFSVSYLRHVGHSTPHMPTSGPVWGPQPLWWLCLLASWLGSHYLSQDALSSLCTCLRPFLPPFLGYNSGLVSGSQGLGWKAWSGPK